MPVRVLGLERKTGFLQEPQECGSAICKEVFDCGATEECPRSESEGRNVQVPRADPLGHFGVPVNVHFVLMDTKTGSGGHPCCVRITVRTADCIVSDSQF